MREGLAKENTNHYKSAFINIVFLFRNILK